MGEKMNVIFPSATVVPEELQKLGKLPAIIYPINQKIAFDYLYDQYKDQNFVIIGFPANNFMGQEPGTNEEIAKFCSVNYDVTFPIMAKISVKGKDMAPLYHWLTEKKLNGKQDAPVQWNFQKFMIDENGNWVGFVAPKESPFSETIISWIEKK